MHPSLTKGPRALKTSLRGIHKVFNIDASQTETNHGTSPLSLLPSHWTRNHSEVANLAGTNGQVAGRTARFNIAVLVAVMTATVAVVMVIVAVSAAMVMVVVVVAASAMLMMATMTMTVQAALLHLLLALFLLDSLGSKDASDQQAEREKKLGFMHALKARWLHPSQPRSLLYPKRLSVHLTELVYIPFKSYR
jgi:hypothetical protein